jgi:hypothetical protein
MVYGRRGLPGVSIADLGVDEVLHDRSILPSKISRKPSKKELRYLTLNHQACNFLVDAPSRDDYQLLKSSIGMKFYHLAYQLVYPFCHSLEFSVLLYSLWINLV